MNKIKKNIAIFLASRFGSKRLPKKHFLKLDKNLQVIDLCILRLKKAKLVKKIFLCTTTKKIDENFKKITTKHNVHLFRGNTNNVLKRFIDCANENKINTIVRITADCPLIDSNLVDKCIKIHFEKKSDYTSNTIKLSYPDGLDVEVIKLSALINSQKLSRSKLNLEHVTSFIRSSNIFKKTNLKSNINYSNRRWTLDYKTDYFFLKKVIKYFKPNIYFKWQELIEAEKNYKYLLNTRQR